jgi:hypothetical protein
MEKPPESPGGYTEPQEYELKTWVKGIVAIVLAILCHVIVESLNGLHLISDEPLSLITAVLVGITASLYLHESTHYVVDYYFNYEPNFLWPNKVECGVYIIRTKPIVASLLAPQLLSIPYAALIYIGVTPTLELVLVSGLCFNLIGGYDDIPWAIRRLTWPKRTITINENSKDYVSFPKE